MQQGSHLGGREREGGGEGEGEGRKQTVQINLT